MKFLRYRCVASLGNNLYERSYEYLKDCNQEGASAEEKREGLISILGEDCIGFWAILDQILFFETMVDELSLMSGDVTGMSEIDDKNGSD
mmetsp:Transcript_94/g.184  ORF Transcript_94/g.184 Transcript_94/m.184 type:complete len:90 (+) Transcript_94:411-680(+)